MKRVEKLLSIFVHHIPSYDLLPFDIDAIRQTHTDRFKVFLYGPDVYAQSSICVYMWKMILSRCYTHGTRTHNRIVNFSLLLFCIYAVVSKFLDLLCYRSTFQYPFSILAFIGYRVRFIPCMRFKSECLYNLHFFIAACLAHSFTFSKHILQQNTATTHRVDKAGRIWRQIPAALATTIQGKRNESKEVLERRIEIYRNKTKKNENVQFKYDFRMMKPKNYSKSNKLFWKQHSSQNQQQTVYFQMFFFLFCTLSVELIKDQINYKLNFSIKC